MSGNDLFNAPHTHSTGRWRDGSGHIWPLVGSLSNLARSLDHEAPFHAADSSPEVTADKKVPRPSAWSEHV